MPQLRFVFFGLSITSSWGNGHATTYRGLVRELTLRGHQVVFLERDVPWYAENRDLACPPFGKTILYETLGEAKDRFARIVRDSDVVIVGSYVPDGIALGEWVVGQAGGITAFYDIDTPVTLSKLEKGDAEYISAPLIARYDLYLSFTGGPILRKLERKYGAVRARVLHCSVDTRLYHPEERDQRWDLGYLGTYDADRQKGVETLLCEPARRWQSGKFVVAGPLYPESIRWPANVERLSHVSPGDHRAFYNSQRFTLNVTRSDMVRAGHSPSVRLFEAAACGSAIITDYWAGLEKFLRPGRDILVSRSAAETLVFLKDVPEKERLRIGKNARDRVLTRHTAAHRAAELEEYVLESAAAKVRSYSGVSLPVVRQ